MMFSKMRISPDGYDLFQAPLAQCGDAGGGCSAFLGKVSLKMLHLEWLGCVPSKSFANSTKKASEHNATVN